MPTLNWIGKDKVVNHHQEVPYRVLEHRFGFRDGEQTSEDTGMTCTPKVRQKTFGVLLCLKSTGNMAMQNG